MSLIDDTVFPDGTSRSSTVRVLRWYLANLLIRWAVAIAPLGAARDLLIACLNSMSQEVFRVIRGDRRTLH